MPVNASYDSEWRTYEGKLLVQSYFPPRVLPVSPRRKTHGLRKDDDRVTYHELTPQPRPAIFVPLYCEE